MRRITFLLTVMLFSQGCGDGGLLGGDYRPDATGIEGQITVVIDSVLWNGTVGEALQIHVGGSIETLPSAEPEFDLEAIGLTSSAAFDMAKDRKNVMIVGLIADSSSENITTESEYLNTIFSNDSLRQMILEGSPALVARPNHWRRNQLVYYLAAASPSDLIMSLEQNSEQLRYHFNEVSRTRLHRDMFDIGRQHDIEQALIEEHQFAVNAQHDYFIAIDTTQFVWLRRSLTDTWRSLFVYYEEEGDPSKLNADWIARARDALTQRYISGTAGGWIEIDRRRPMTIQEINFKDRYAIEFRGLWHMVGEDNGRKFPFGMGGPFVTYAFYDEPTQRLYLIDGMVFAPNFSKREFMRQMEVIAYTFRTLQEVEGESV
ncbi:MAG: DUF4837 family protein [Bacteroidetes bacterium]|nr:DUF4837 family protein [Bacteroidota bacterium]MCY4204545.1 DUF4837 family protein [Bacteroidota bacterium]